LALSCQCPDCGRNWPKTRPYALCPECRCPTRVTVTGSVMTPAEAREHTRHIEFIRYCSQRDQEREERGEPSPEDIGRQEAIELNLKWREAVAALGELRS
jgi:hypothetical protein